MDELSSDVRAADADRERVAEQLRKAHDQGRLTLAEFDDRVAAAWAARTYGELAPVTADLPTLPTDAERAPATRPDMANGSPVRAWVTVSVINLLIWGVVSLATLSVVYPWWIWVAGPWGLMMLLRRGSQRGSVAVGAS